MRIVSPLLKRIVYPALSSIGAFRLGSNAGLAILTYHGVIPPGYESIDATFDGNLINADTLRRQVRLLKKHYEVVSPAEVLAFLETGEKLPSRAILLSCDDGLLNCLTEMLPVLREEGVKCLFFVTAASAAETRAMLWYEELFLLFVKAPSGSLRASGGNLVIDEQLQGREQRRVVWWSCVRRMSALDVNSRAHLMDEIHDRITPPGESILHLQDPSMRSRLGLMTRPEVTELISAGMTIGAHTMSHPILSCQNPSQAYEEISQCRLTLESALGVDVWALAYPFGSQQSTTPEIIAMAEKAGYRAAFLNFGGGFGSHLPRYALPRIHVTDQMSLSELQAHISGFYGRLRGFRNDSGTVESTSIAS